MPLLTVKLIMACTQTTLLLHWQLCQLWRTNVHFRYFL
jgi:hypothetical protein